MPTYACMSVHLQSCSSVYSEKQRMFPSPKLKLSYYHIWKIEHCGSRSSTLKLQICNLICGLLKKLRESPPLVLFAFNMLLTNTELLLCSQVLLFNCIDHTGGLKRCPCSISGFVTQIPLQLSYAMVERRESGFTVAADVLREPACATCVYGQSCLCAYTEEKAT